ncbi:MAG: hypothetical protein FJ109_01610 [Deltaproteobacteria bacterium]|nr:hypothetical protein [Deltaproteobacteria bacterium]
MSLLVLSGSPRRISKWIAVLLAGLFAGSCSAASDPSRHLPLAVRELVEAVTWKHYPVVARYAVGTDGSLAGEIRKRSEAVEMAESEVVDVAVSADGDHAAVLVRYTWYTSRDTTLKSGHELQHWARARGGWYIESIGPPVDPAARRSPFVMEEDDDKSPQN